MRNTGKTFRVLLQAIYLTSSLSDDKRGVVLYAHNRDYCKELFKKCIGMINVYGGWKYEFYSKDMTIRFPNDKTLSFKSMQEPKEKSYGIDWTLYDELSDNYIPRDNTIFHEAMHERTIRRKRGKK